jgi:PAS domain S-box-containing protein
MEKNKFNHNNEYLLSILKNLPHGVYIVSKTFDIEFVNEVIEKEFGDIDDKKCYEYFHGRTSSCPWCKNREVFSGQNVRWEWYSEKNDKYYDLFDIPITNPDGTVSKLEIFIDITKLRKAEQLASKEREQLKVTLYSIGDGVITTDVNGNILLINKVAEQLTGSTQKSAEGKPIQEIFNIINEKTGKPCENPVEKVLTTEKIVKLANNTALISRNGKKYSIEDSGAPIFDSENKIIGTVLVFQNATEKKQIEKELFKSKRIESLGILAGGIAHDFNNILTGIMGNIELAKMCMDSPDEVHSLLDDAKKASLRAKDLTQQLLTFSKGGEPVKQRASIGEIIMESANFILHGSSVVCNCNIPVDLWKVDVDTGQIGQVVQNLLLNSLHAMCEGGVIEISCENISSLKDEKLFLHDNKYIKITISDTGSGISEKDLEKIFDPYFSTKKTGNGLGLAICYSIIKKHDGTITVKSKIKKGTVFTIYLPATFEIDDTILQSCESVVKVECKVRVLLMDDDMIIYKVAKKFFEYLGYDMLFVENGYEAIELYKKYFENNETIDIVIMDLTIPGSMGGKEAVWKILGIDQDAKVIVSSGYSNDSVMTNYEEHGFKAAIEKPFQLEKLKKIIAKVLNEKNDG